MTNLSKQYQPKEVEEKIYKMWETGKFFVAKIDPHQKPYVVAIPPPNVTGSLHMGHALNNTIQDILIRYHRMAGEPSLWIPGTDHAGIATQNVVEKELAKEGKTRHDLGREEFVKRVWAWREKYGHIIIDQLKKLGCSCDFSRERFTLDEGYSQAVQEAFEHYYKKGWIYQGERIVNWCPRCQSSLSDLEVEHKEKEGKLYFIKYPLVLTTNHNKSQPKGRNHNVITDYITVATTRPETMLGDTAVAVNPRDTKYTNIIGKKVIIPLINRIVPVVADEAVDIKFGTGAVKVTPGHDPNDFEIGQRHNLPAIKVIDEEGKIIPLRPSESLAKRGSAGQAKEGGVYAGLTRAEAREKILADLEKQGLLEKTQDYSYSLPLCSRCDTLLEQLLSKQWFLKMDELVKPAILAIEKGEVKFYPPRFKRLMLEWLKNIKDWCISRQIWWGHRLPVWQSEVKSKKAKVKREIYVGDNPPAGYVQVDDVLDTWFSSALWPFAILGWPGRKAADSKFVIRDSKFTDFDYFYPTTFLSTARDILYLWVARMIFSGLELTGQPPFHDVYIHPTILNIKGQRMSKSLGTGVDPLELIEKYGADATRFGLIWQNTGVQDIKFDENAVLSGRNFANKIWNATRFVQGQISNAKVKVQKLKEVKPITPADETILKQLDKTQKQVEQNLKTYQFGQALQTIYHFFWHQFCDVYIEKSKQQLQDKKLIPSTLNTLNSVLTTSLKLLHPFMPFITEEIWQNLGEKKPLIISAWPK
jgi:valyl-tRNA synthetase